MSTDLLDNLDQAFRFAELVVAPIDEKQRSGPTPCPDFDVTALVGHLVSGTRWYADIPELGVADPSKLDHPDLTEQDLSAAFREQADRARTSWTPARLSQEYNTPYGSMTGVEMTEFMVMELVAHGIDLAMATGQAARPDQDLLGVAFGITTGMGDNLRVPKMMGPEVPVAPDAPLLDRFLGLIGRDPAWSPSPADQS
jgi:uncharacterized protein (TIGR03086 family)